MSFISFDNVVSWLDSQTNLEKLTTGYTKRTYRLDRMRSLLEHLGNPERKFRSIHVAGSKGKGSTSAFMAGGLTALGFKTGLYMSPHMSDYRERFTLSGTFFSDEELIGAANELKESINGFSFSDEWGPAAPTTFELYTALAYILFARTGCDWAVIETGLGGRLDATNTLCPEAVVLCPIELEHTSILGGTLPLIAGEKAKIIMPGTPVFISHQPQEALEVFLKEAETQKSPVKILPQELADLKSRTTIHGEEADITWKTGEKTHLTLSMMGEVQADNAALALLVLKSLGLYSAGTTEKAIEKCTLPGRFQVLKNSGTPLYIDGAHTVNSLRRLIHSFSEIYAPEKTTVIYGALEDKDHTHMTRLLLEHLHTIIVCRPGTFKKSNPQALYDTFKTEAQELIPDALEALTTAYALTPPDGAVLVCGSFYLAGDIRQAYEEYNLQQDKKVHLWH